MADISNGRFWPVLYSIRFTCIALYLFAVQIKNSKQFECYIFIINRDKFFESLIGKKRGCQLHSPVCIKNTYRHPQKKIKNKKHFPSV